MTRIKDLPERDRPRERLAARGPRALSDAEVLAILIDRGSVGRSALDAGRDLLAKFGSLGAIASATVQAVRETAGVGEAAAIRVLAGLEAGRRLAEERPKARGDVRLDPEIEAWRRRLAHETREIAVAVLLDARGRKIGEVEVTAGTLAANMLPPREVLKHALGRGAAGVLVIHNHPSGDPTPSREDLEATDRLADAARAVGVELVDHVVVATGGVARILGGRWRGKDSNLRRRSAT